MLVLKLNNKVTVWFCFVCVNGLFFIREVETPWTALLQVSSHHWIGVGPKIKTVDVVVQVLCISNHLVSTGWVSLNYSPSESMTATLCKENELGMDSQCLSDNKLRYLRYRSVVTIPYHCLLFTLINPAIKCSCWVFHHYPLFFFNVFLLHNTKIRTNNGK